MNQDDFKKLLDEALDPIKHTLDHHSDVIENQLLPSVVSMEQTIKVYGDMYKMNNDNVKKLEKRIEPLEEKADIEAPPELVLSEIR